MTSCPSQFVLEALLADQLSAPDEANLEEHVRECPRCQETLETMTADTRTGRAQPTGKDETRFQGGNAGLPQPVLAPRLPVPPEDNPLARPALPILPGYEILDELGRGGMGIVYRARQTMLNRMVALKMLRGGVQADGADRARFLGEAEAVARLHHPNIVQIFDIGVTAGQPYFALELVEGGTLSSQIDGTPQPPRVAAAVVETLARAIHAAHERGILHRDLKPGNILVRGELAKPASHHSPLATDQIKITDFGLAKFLDQNSQLTQTRDIIGTPSYMAPEQARGGGRAITPATDIYALGAILYEMLTGRPPFHAQTPYDTVLQVVHEEPVPPAQLQRKVPRDLETICLKCLEKEPGHRYPTALALADDLRRFLRDEPVQARPVSLAQRTFKWVRRRPLLAGLLVAVVCLTVVALASLTAAVRQARAAERVEADRRQQEAGLRRAAEQEQHRAEQLSARTLLDLGSSQCEKGNFDHGLHHFVRALALAVQLSDPDLEYAARANLACWRPYYLRAWGQLPHKHWVWAVAFSPDGRRAATGSKDGTACVWDAATGEPVTPPLPHQGPVWALAFSPDGRTLLTGSGDTDGAAQLWDAMRGTAAGAPLSHPEPVRAVAFRPDGQTFLTMCASRVQLWETAGRQPVGPPLRHRQPILTARFSPDGKTVVTGSADRTAALWQGSTDDKPSMVLRHPAPVTAAAFSPGGDVLLTGCTLEPEKEGNPVAGTARFWRVATGEYLGPPLAQQGPVKAVAFSPDGRTAVTAGLVPGNPANRTPRGEARLWRAHPDDLKVGQQLGPILEHPLPVWDVAFSPTGQTLLTGCEDRRARLWATANGNLIATSPLHEGTVRQVAYSPDGRTILTASTSSSAAGRLWEAPPELGLVGLRTEIDGIQAWDFSLDGKLVVVGGQTGRVEVWDAATGRRLGPPLEHPEQPVHATTLTPDGRTLLVGTELPGKGGALHIWDWAAGKETRAPVPHESTVRAIACTADNRLMLTATQEGKVRLWDAGSTEPRYVVQHTKAVRSLHFSPDNRTFGSGSEDRTARLWETASGKLLHTWTHADVAKGGGFSPDGRLFLTCSERERTSRVWNVDTGKLLGSPRLHSGSVHGTGFHPDGRSYFASTWEGAFQRCDIALGKPLGPELPMHQMISVVLARPNARVLIGGYVYQGATLCDAPSAIAGDVAHVKLAVEVLTGREMDTDGMTRVLPPAEWQARRLELARRGPSPFASLAAPVRP